MAQKNIVNQEPLEEDKIDKRQKVFTRKALQNAVEEKRRQMIASKTKLVKILKATEGLNTGTETENILRDISHISEEFKVFLEELYELYAQDKYKLFGDEALLNEESLLLKHAYFKIQRIKNSQSDKLLDSKSVRSRNSRRSESILSRASACSSARLKALAEAAAARESAEYDKMLAQRELERKTREQELERQREEERAKYERDTAILSANKKVAIADAKLKALDQALEDELNGSVNSFEDDIPPINENPNENEESQQRTRDWVGSNEFPTETVPRGDNDRENHAHSPQTPRPQHVNFDFREINPQNRFGCPPYMSTPLRDITGNNLIESLTSANQQIVAGSRLAFSYPKSLIRQTPVAILAARIFG